MHDMNKGWHSRALGLSVVLHVAVFAALLLRMAPDVVVPAEVPLSVELWAGGGSGKASSVAPPVVPEVAPLAPPVPAQAIRPPAPSPSFDAEVKLAAAKDKPKPEPVKAVPAKPEPKPQPKPEPKPEPKPQAVTPPAKPAPAAKAAAKHGNVADDFLGDLGGPAGSGQGSVTQKGGKSGIVGGSAQGRPGADAGYLDKVRGRIRPYVMVPPGMSGNPEAVLKVSLLPTLEVRAVSLVKSSGNAAYDRAVQDAVWQARTFPPLPAGAHFADFREYTLKFRPHD
ncbi:TonB family protein [Craterilacuibacter sp. RT1T]|uniref:TonB family protein n=1 Tax=Craterilacuibacter sp. RT1T TaxID=2942211 RepID=UPI0020BEB45B|nr:TonB family protein [Craterilacuibacter sp. RT1T]MCL6263943.1 TonB family protein [Craterilacuibacter sp. RT1T]